MNLFKRKKNFSLFLFLFFVLVAACTKIITSDIGSGLIPPVDGVITKDTVLDVITKNSGEDTIRVGLYDDHTLGYTDDPLFGKTTADINVQVYPPYFPYTFDTTADSRILDSVVLVLSYRGAWGDSTQHLSLNVYDMPSDEPFSKDSLYTNVKRFAEGNLLTENNVAKDVDITALNDSVHLFNEAAINQLRIRLNNSFGEKLLNEFDSTSEYKNDTLFRAALNGFQIKAEQQMGNALIRINLQDTNTKLAIYYKFKDTSGGYDTTVRYFRANPFYSASSNYILRDRTNAQVAQFFPPNSNAQDSLLYLQTEPGLYSTINIPGLSGLPNMIVHRAELLMEQVPDNTSRSDTYFTAPNLFLAAYSQDSARRFAIPNDIQFFNGSIANLISFGVLPNKKVSTSGDTLYNYNFELSRYVQGIVTRKEPVYELVLYAPFNSYIYPFETATFTSPISSFPLNFPAIGRVRLSGGSNHIANPNCMRLHIIYSLL